MSNAISGVNLDGTNATLNEKYNKISNVILSFIK